VEDVCGFLAITDEEYGMLTGSKNETYSDIIKSLTQHYTKT